MWLGVPCGGIRDAEIPLLPFLERILVGRWLNLNVCKSAKGSVSMAFPDFDHCSVVTYESVVFRKLGAELGRGRGACCLRLAPVDRRGKENLVENLIENLVKPMEQM